MKGLLVILCCPFFLSDKTQFQPSPNGHYLLRDGKVFFWLGDTDCELFHRLTREQADQSCYWFVINLGRRGDKILQKTTR